MKGRLKVTKNMLELICPELVSGPRVHDFLWGAWNSDLPKQGRARKVVVERVDHYACSSWPRHVALT